VDIWLTKQENPVRVLFFGDPITEVSKAVVAEEDRET
jgi:transcription-repair coupling factor (superfamily II helicase)